MSSGEKDTVPARIRSTFAAAALLLLVLPATAFAQASDAPPTPPAAIDIKVDTAPSADDEPPECSAQEQDAAAISGEIVVCGRRQGAEHRLHGAEESRERYARETMFKGDPQAPDVAGPGIFRGPATVSGLCLIPPCPPPPAYMVDFSQIPETPPGSDADRVGRGLAPLDQAEPAPAESAPAEPVASPTGSASPKGLP